MNNIDKTERLDHIQILRGISVTLVVLYHYFPESFPGGYVGVDLFFVISGYVITKSLVSEKELTLSSLPSFYRHRLFRIVPGYLAVALIAFLISFFMYLPEDFKNVSKHLAGAILFINNIILHMEVGYFDIGGEFKPLLHYWSLSVEEQFYLVYPAILLLAFSLFHKNARRTTLISVLCLLSLIFFLVLNKTYPSLAFYMMPTRFWELSSGGLLYFAGYGVKNGRQPDGKVALLTVLVLTLSVVKFDSNAIQSVIAVAIALTYLAFASCTLAGGGMLSRFLLVFRRLGTISYSLYLTHWPAYSIAYVISQAQPSPVYKVFLIVLSVVLAVLLYSAVERPFIRLGRKTVARPCYVTKETVTLLSAMLLVFGLSSYVFFNNGLEAGSTGEKYKLSIAGHWDNEYAHCDRLAGARYNFDLSCTSNFDKFHKKFVVIGDSHADQYFVGLARVGAEYGYAGMHVGSNGCPPLLGVSRVERPGCSAYLKEMIDAVATDASVDTVFIAARWAYYIQGITSPGEPVGLVHFLDETESQPIENSSAVRSGLNNLVAQLRRQNKRVIVIDQVPEFSIDPRKFQFYRHSLLQVSEQVFKERRTTIVQDVVQSISSEDAGVKYFDPAVLFCRNGYCTATNDGQFFYRDDDHLNCVGSVLVANKLFSAINMRNSSVASQM